MQGLGFRILGSGLPHIRGIRTIAHWGPNIEVFSEHHKIRVITIEVSAWRVRGGLVGRRVMGKLM